MTCKAVKPPYTQESLYRDSLLCMGRRFTLQAWFLYRFGDLCCKHWS